MGSVMLYVAQGKRTSEDANRILLNKEIGRAEIEPYVIRSSVATYFPSRDDVKEG